MAAPCKRLAAVLTIISFIVAPSLCALSQDSSPDYEGIFGSHYRDACEFIAQHGEMTAAMRAANVTPGFAWSIVFPELIRWSALADVIQTSNLQALYVQFGRKYSDFSVGRFQMKPSFAEILEADYNRLFDAKEKEKLGFMPYNSADTPENRRARVKRLTDFNGQVQYLIIFLRVMEKLYPQQNDGPLEAKLAFYATAYNVGYKKGVAAIKKELKIRRFHTGLIAAGQTYNYADIALRYYRTHEQYFSRS